MKFPRRPLPFLYNKRMERKGPLFYPAAQKKDIP